MVSKDLVHWTRLPPPIVPNMNPTGVPHPDWYDQRGSWDGSLSVPNGWNGIREPVVVMTAETGKHPGTVMAVVAIGRGVISTRPILFCTDNHC